MHTALRWKSKIADLYAITPNQMRQFYTLQCSDIQYFLLHLADNKETEMCLFIVLASHMN